MIWRVASRYPEPFDVIADAQGVALGPTGVAAYRSPAFEAYERALTVAAQHDELLMDMVQHATPAGRIYAALLLAEAGSTRVTEAWQRLALQNDPVSLATGGCMVYRTTLAEYARGALRGRTPLGVSLQTASDVTTPRLASAGAAGPHAVIAWLRGNGRWLIGIFWLCVALGMLFLNRR
jgi:hypothetical protein